MKPLRETDIVRACLDLLAARKILAWRSNSGGVTGEYKGKKRFVRFNTMPGMSDICAVVPIMAYKKLDKRSYEIDAHRCGVFWAIEVKRPGGKPTEGQEAFLAAVNKAGGVGIVVHSADELDKYLRSNR